MVLFSAQKLAVQYREKPLFHDVTFAMEAGEKIGLIGLNGTGKSTLLRIIAGIEKPENGTVTYAGGLTIGYLSQEPNFQGDGSVIDWIFRGKSAKEREENEYLAKTILTKLGIVDFNQEISTLSGGQKKRVAIAGVLTNPCDLLVLDEPTNHIDSSMVTWLENYLRGFKGGILMVTHDRYFLDSIAGNIFEIEDGALYRYQTNYSGYLLLKSQRIDMENAAKRKRRALLEKETEWIQRGARARGTKSRSRIQRYEQLRQLDNTEKEQVLELGSVASRLGKKTIEWRGIGKSYGGRSLIHDFSYILPRDGRIGIVGKNGCGKSTLLNIICGQVQPDYGEVIFGETVKVGYFTQGCEQMEPKQRVLDYIREVAENVRTREGILTASQMLEKFLFRGEMQGNPIGKLSGGERRRLYLLRILMSAPNVLLLDEPTNDLDIETLRLLEDYLEDFPGAVIAVSHDRYFLDRIARCIFAFEEGGNLRQYMGGYTDYINQAGEDKKIARKEKIDIREKRPKKLKFTYKEAREYETIDQEVADLEEVISNIQVEMEQCSSDYEKIQRMLEAKEAAEATLEEKMERWLYLNELAEKIAQQSMDK